MWQHFWPHAGILQWQLTETTIYGYVCHSARTRYPDPETTSLCSFSFMLCAQRRFNKYQCYSLWFVVDRDSNPRSTTLEASTLTTTLPTWLIPARIIHLKTTTYKCIISLFSIHKLTDQASNMYVEISNMQRNGNSDVKTIAYTVWKCIWCLIFI